MNSFHPFNASNAPRTCLWCGRKIRPSRTVGAIEHGFDSESCAAQFGVSAARLGFRLKKSEPRTIQQIRDDMAAGRS